MARPKLINRPREKTLSLPETLVEKVDKLLFSELESRVPHGAWSRYVTNLIEADMYEREQFDVDAD